jgi:hypothetical protein
MRDGHWLSNFPYIIFVKTCGKQWDLPKFVDVLFVSLEFPRLLIYDVKSVHLHAPLTQVPMPRKLQRSWDVAFECF